MRKLADRASAPIQATAADRQTGVTFIELLAVMVVIGVLTTIVVTRGLNYQSVDALAKTYRLHDHLRYAQSLAMKQNAVWGIKSDGARYWLFSGTDPDLAASRRVLPSESGNTMDFAGITGFTVLFDGYGRPYAAYTSSLVNTPYSAALTIQTSALTSTLSPETGYIQ